MLVTSNKFSGFIKSMTVGQIMAEVIISSGNKPDLVSVISRDSARRMGLKVGDQVSAVVRATEVMIKKN